ncbi:hypothetical protein RHMOL_Rhmol06G0115100 [Rhododendron molle]|uniref:Uncharacterized protein n=1 Tax=Rhododendron molle TaxID=49168 RepID=A0ACC0NCK8_RHOML|nr:hypothetical protein RHMOL_Rhmol06G0115100 [Rhododendron molle]
MNSQELQFCQAATSAPPKTSSKDRTLKHKYHCKATSIERTQSVDKICPDETNNSRKTRDILSQIRQQVVDLERRKEKMKKQRNEVEIVPWPFPPTAAHGYGTHGGGEVRK